MSKKSKLIVEQLKLGNGITAIFFNNSHTLLAIIYVLFVIVTNS